jgi:hypothetical protein
MSTHSSYVSIHWNIFHVRTWTENLYKTQRAQSFRACESAPAELYRWHVYFSRWVLHTSTFPPCRDFSLFFFLVRPVSCQSKRMNALDIHTFPSNPDSTILVVEYLPICYTLCLLWRIIPSSSRRQIIYRISTYIFFRNYSGDSPLSCYVAWSD